MKTQILMSNFLYFTKSGLSMYFWIIKLLCLYLGSPSLTCGLISSFCFSWIIGTTFFFCGLFCLSSSLNSSLIVSIYLILGVLTLQLDLALSGEETSSSGVNLILFSEYPLYGLLFFINWAFLGCSDFYFYSYIALISFSIVKLSFSFLGKPVQYFSIRVLICGRVLQTWMPWPWLSLVAFRIHML